MLTRTQWVGVAVLAAVLCAGCGGSSAPTNSTTSGTKADDSRDAANLARRGHTPGPSVVVVTLHVKDMGTKLNLL